MGRLAWILAVCVGLSGVFIGYQVSERGRALLALRDEYAKEPLRANHAEALHSLTSNVAAAWNVSFGLVDARRGFPVVVSPAKGAAFTLDTLATLVAREMPLFQNLLFTFGAVLFRDFPIHTSQSFERLAQVLEPNLDDHYLGTSPRLLVANTTHVFSASEFPGYIVIPTHCEMSFTQAPPPTIIFYALRAPDAHAGGETPLADFGAVWEDLPEDVREFFASNELLNVRSYFSEDRLNINPFMTKSWQEMFETQDKGVALKAALSNGFNTSFNERDIISLENRSPVTRPHPRTGKPVWHNHLQVFFPNSIASEFAITSVRTASLFANAMSSITDLVIAVNTMAHGLESIGQYTMRGDRTPVPHHIMDAVRATIWKHTVVYPYHSGDVVWIDNMRVAHGRQPYRGARTVQVSWGGK